jgi:hypothetical protein
MGTIPFKKIKYIKRLYYEKQFSMKKVSEELKVSIDALVYFMRKYGLKRRTPSENEKIKFDRKPLSFNLYKNSKANELKAVGTMLYWGEGAKGGKIGKNNSVDFANSDPRMILAFLCFLRKFCEVKESKLRCLLYCYSDQSSDGLIRYWSRITHIPVRQFTKPYIRQDFRKDGRKMKYGLIHVRYNDKKLLIEIENMIESYVSKYAPIV